MSDSATEEMARSSRVHNIEASRARMLDGPIAKTLLMFGLPILGGSLLQALNLTVANFWIARLLDVDAITAAGNANLIAQFLLAVFLGIGVAANILIAQSVGADDWIMLKRVVGTATTFIAAASSVAAVAGVVFAPSIVELIGTPPFARPQAIIYLRVLSLGLPLPAFFPFAQMAQQSAGDSRTPFLFMFLAICINAVLSPVLILQFDGPTRLGIAGSACAMLIGQAAAIGGMLVYLYRSRSQIMLRRAELHNLHPDRSVLRALITRGFPITVTAAIWQLSALVMIGMVNHYGAVTAAAYSAANQIWNYLQLPAMALGTAATAMAAQNIGAGQWARVEKVARSAVIAGLVLTTVTSGLIYLSGDLALQVFLPANSPSILVAMHINSIVVWTFVIYSVTLQLIGIVRSTGAVWPATIIAFVALVCARLAFAKALQPYWGADAIWWSFPVGVALSVIMHSLYYRYGAWRSATMLEPRATDVRRKGIDHEIAF